MAYTHKNNKKTYLIKKIEFEMYFYLAVKNKCNDVYNNTCCLTLNKIPSYTNFITK